MSPYFIEKCKLFCKIVCFCISIWLCGLFLFLSKIPDYQEQQIVDTDATIILTGGSLRVEEGLKLPSNKFLISGIGPGVTKQDIKRTLKDSDIDISDDVVLGGIASSTFTNAYETKIFMDLHRYHSMRVITSNYHIPRTQLIFNHVMPDFEILYHPVYPENFRKEGYYISWPSLVMMMNEYNKFCGALAIIYDEKFTQYWDDVMLSIAESIKERFNIKTVKPIN